VLFPASGGYEVSLAKRAHTDAFELHQAFDEQMSFHEKLRLLYVALQRALAITSLSPSIAPNERAKPGRFGPPDARGAAERRGRGRERGPDRAHTGVTGGRRTGIGLATAHPRHLRSRSTTPRSPPAPGGTSFRRPRWRASPTPPPGTIREC